MVVVFNTYYMPGTMVSIFYMLCIYNLTSLRKNEGGIIPFSKWEWWRGQVIFSRSWNLITRNQDINPRVWQQSLCSNYCSILPACSLYSNFTNSNKFYIYVPLVAKLAIKPSPSQNLNLWKYWSFPHWTLVEPVLIVTCAIKILICLKSSGNDLAMTMTADIYLIWSNWWHVHFILFIFILFFLTCAFKYN